MGKAFVVTLFSLMLCLGCSSGKGGSRIPLRQSLEGVLARHSGEDAADAFWRIVSKYESEQILLFGGKVPIAHGYMLYTKEKDADRWVIDSSDAVLTTWPRNQSSLHFVTSKGLVESMGDIPGGEKVVVLVTKGDGMAIVELDSEIILRSDCF